MSWIDYLIVLIPVLIVVWAALKTQRYVRGVSDFLAAGRVARRYVLSVASGEAAVGLISVVANMEMYYKSGFSLSFWSNLSMPISLIMGLMGFCIYRFRETRAFTMGQFFEIRYSKSLRVVAAIIQSASGIINYAIFPAVGARFLMYFLDLPVYVRFLGMNWSTFGLLMAFFLGLALFIALLGGQVTIMVTDCVQGLLSYPMFVLIVGYFFWRFSWSEHMTPAILARPPGESFVNPYDTYNLRDFNIFYATIGIVTMFFTRMTWSGTQGYNSAAKTAHEAKMGGLLGTWRGLLSGAMYLLMAAVAYTYLNHANFAGDARRIRHWLADKTIEDVASGQQYSESRKILHEKFKAIPQRTKFSQTYKTSAEFHKETADPYQEATAEVLKDLPNGKKTAQTFKTIYGQMLVPVALREIFPVGLTGIFCAIMLFLMVSTDTTYMHSWGSILIQDLVVPFLKKPMTPKQQINALRIAIASVCAFAFLFSFFFSQFDYILMFFAITGAIWSGAGVVITLGLYWKRGCTAAAFAALIAGAVISVSGIVIQANWANYVYPWLESMGWVEGIGHFLEAASRPFNPYVIWTMNPHKFPINSRELAFISQVTCIFLYIIISLCRRGPAFNMDKMLHRGIYSDDKSDTVQKSEGKKKLSIGNFIVTKVIGITSSYTLGDKILAWSVFSFSFIYQFCLCFVAVVIWNLFYRWPTEWWSTYFFWRYLGVASILGLVTTFWFGICGTRDLLQLFKDLENHEVDDSDNGSVKHED